MELEMPIVLAEPHTLFSSLFAALVMAVAACVPFIVLAIILSHYWSRK